MKEKFIEPWLDCALHVECIAPKGSKGWPCGHIINHDGHYIGCHRYDQSALNLILAREFGPEVAMIVRNHVLFICHTTCMRATPTGRIAFLVVGGMPLKRMEKAGSHVSRPVGIVLHIAGFRMT